MPEALVGEYGSGFYPQDTTISLRRYLDMREGIQMLNPRVAPFFTLLSKLRKENAEDTYFRYMEDEYFTYRNFTADYVVVNRINADGASVDESVAFLRLRNPSDMQGLEAPPHLSDGGYATDGTTLHFKVSDGTNVMNLFFEKNAVHKAGTWRTVDPSSGGIWSGLNTDWTASDASGAVDTTEYLTGYLLMIGYDDDGTFDASACSNWRNGTTGSITADECVMRGTTIDAAPSTLAAAWDGHATNTVDTTEVTVEVITPNLYDGGGFYEGAGLPEETRKTVRSGFNVTQIYKTPYTITGTAQAIRWKGGAELARKRKRHGIAHKIDIENSLFFNGEYSDTGGESPKRTTRGLGVGKGATLSNAGYIKTHNVDAYDVIHDGDGLTHTTNPYLIENNSTDFYGHLSDAFERMFDHPNSSGTKLLMVGQPFKGAFTKNANPVGGANAPWAYDPGIGAAGLTVGLEITGYRTAFGLVNVVYNPILQGQYKNYGVVIDFDNVRLRPIPGRDTHIVTGTQTNDTDGLGETYLTELGLELMFEQTCGIIKMIPDQGE